MKIDYQIAIKKYSVVKWLYSLILICVIGCVKDASYDSAKIICETDLHPNISFREIKALYLDETIEIQDDYVLEGYINSSDKAGNFFGVLHFQDAPTDPLDGFQIEIDLRDSHLFYNLGDRVLIKLKGLYLGESRGVYKLGGAFVSFGNLSVGRLPTNKVYEHILATCDNSMIAPTQTTIPALGDIMVNTLITLDDVEINSLERGKTFAVKEEETNRMLNDCNDNELIMVNSGYSDFQNDLLPEGRGSITGLLTKENDEFRLIINDTTDINFNKERCEHLITEFTSNKIFLSELADPDNNSGARFVELYNSGTEQLSLNGWKLLRYTNASIEISSELDLSNYTIYAESTLVISSNATEFETVYGFLPDVVTGSNSPADSNGDDNLQLVDPFGTVIDVFGRIGEDESGTDHEFEDGSAIRKPEILNGNPNYTFIEWELCNDTGESGTLNQIKNAPEDYTPGTR
jgi:hypothetical protein